MNLTTYATEKGGTGKLKCPVLTSIALAAGCSPAVLYMISRGHKRPSPDMAKKISAATDGVVSKHELRPDIFDAPADAAAA
jgi:DNA-binding transcriptional regulator YdaS (Cro superfamily)